MYIYTQISTYRHPATFSIKFTRIKFSHNGGGRQGGITVIIVILKASSIGAYGKDLRR
jgi:hypothetical protein